MGQLEEHRTRARPSEADGAFCQAQSCHGELGKALPHVGAIIAVQTQNARRLGQSV